MPPYLFQGVILLTARLHRTLSKLQTLCTLLNLETPHRHTEALSTLSFEQLNLSSSIYLLHAVLITYLTLLTQLVVYPSLNLYLT
nr:MAG TPA: hypothetical protein [Caudoviricetes sp.]